MALVDKLLARTREMRDVLAKVARRSRGTLRAEIDDVLARADRDIPRLNRPIKQVKFSREMVEEAVKACGGDKRAAADRLGCSLRTIYTSLGRK